MAAQIDWTSAVGNLDPAVLDIQLNHNPKMAGDILNEIHNLSDFHDRRTSIALFSASIARLGPQTSARICEEPTGLQRALTGITSTGFLCGFSMDDFLGPDAHWVRPLLMGWFLLSPEAGDSGSIGITHTSS